MQVVIYISCRGPCLGASSQYRRFIWWVWRCKVNISGLMAWSVRGGACLLRLRLKHPRLALALALCWVVWPLCVPLCTCCAVYIIYYIPLYFVYHLSPFLYLFTGSHWVHIRALLLSVPIIFLLSISRCVSVYLSIFISISLSVLYIARSFAFSFHISSYLRLISPLVLYPCIVFSFIRPFPLLSVGFLREQIAPLHAVLLIAH